MSHSLQRLFKDEQHSSLEKLPISTSDQLPACLSLKGFWEVKLYNII